MNHRFLVRLVLWSLFGMLIFALVATAKGAPAELTANVNISQDSLTVYRVTIDLTGTPRELVHLYMTRTEDSTLTYAMVEYRGALDGGGACWDDGTARCYAGLDTNGEEHIDYTFATRSGGPIAHDLFVCRGNSCELIRLELVMPPLEHSYVPAITTGGPNVSTDTR